MNLIERIKDYFQRKSCNHTFEFVEYRIDSRKQVLQYRCKQCGRMFYKEMK